MVSRKWPILGLLLALQPFSHAFAGKGGEGSGGGTSVIGKQGQPVLVDYAANAPDFVDNFDYAKERQLKTHPITAVAGMLQMNGLRFFRINEQAATPLALKRLAFWRDSSPIVSDLLKEAMEHMTLLSVSSFVRTADQIDLKKLGVVLPEGMNTMSRSVTPVAFFAPSINGAVFSEQEFNHLGVNSQAGVLLHEAARKLQSMKVDDSSQDSKEISDEALQKIVYRIMMTDPKENETLDDETLFQGEFMKSVLAGSPKSKLAAANQECQGLKNLIDSGLYRAQAIYQTYCTDAQIRNSDLKWFQEISSTIASEQGELLASASTIAQVTETQQLVRLSEDHCLRQITAGLLPTQLAFDDLSFRLHYLGVETR
jgi:uncharacterized protein YgiM (DUF1202 family)